MLLSSSIRIKDYKTGFKYLAIAVLIAVVSIAGFGFISAIATTVAPTSLDGVGSIATKLNAVALN